VRLHFYPIVTQRNKIVGKLNALVATLYHEVIRSEAKEKNAIGSLSNLWEEIN
jgi:hypothetical protein